MLIESGGHLKFPFAFFCRGTDFWLSEDAETGLK